MAKKKPTDTGIEVRDERLGFAMIDNLLIDEYGPALGAYGIAAYCILVRFANRAGGDSYPSYQTIAELMAASRPTAIRSISILVRLGLVRRETRRKKGETLSNVYTILRVTKPQGIADLPSKPETLPSKPETLPSKPETLPSKPETLPSIPRLHDQYTITNTPYQYTIPIHHDQETTTTTKQDPDRAVDNENENGGGGGFTSSEDGGFTIFEMQTLNQELVADWLPSWWDSKNYIERLDAAGLWRMATWLWTWRTLQDLPHSGGLYDPEIDAQREQIKRLYGPLFQGIENVPAILKTRIKTSSAPLDEADEAELKEILRRMTSERKEQQAV